MHISHMEIYKFRIAKYYVFLRGGKEQEKNHKENHLLFLLKKLKILVKPIVKPALPVTLVAVPKGSNNKYTTVITPIISDEKARYFSSKGATINKTPPGTAATANFESA